MKYAKKLISTLIIATVIAFCVAVPNTLNASADDYHAVFTVIPTGANYQGTNYFENTTISVTSGSIVQIDYFALQSGWMVFGLDTLTSTGSGTELVYKTTLEDNYIAVLDFDNRIVYFRQVYHTDHTHKMTWGQITFPTYNRPTVDTYFCTECYYLGETRPASVASYNSIYKPTAAVQPSNIRASLANVTAGNNVTINLGSINNVSADDMNLIKASNANVTLKYTNANKSYVVTIPAGMCYTSPSIQFYGPEFIRVAYNGTVQ